MSDSQIHRLQNAAATDTPPNQQQGANGEVQHVTVLSENIGSLYLSDDFSDVLIKVEDEQFPSHRVILAARSDYFRAMLFGGLREHGEKEIELIDTPVQAFKCLLKYIYTSKLSLSPLPSDLVLDVLGLAHKYGFAELETSIAEYLKANLSSRNLCAILQIGLLYSLRTLSDHCLVYADRHASEILKTQGFMQLSASAVDLIISRDSFCAPEIEIFSAIREWASAQTEPPSSSTLPSLLARLRLPLIALDDLLNEVRSSGLVASDCILDAIKEQSQKRSSDLSHRGFCVPGVNVVQLPGCQVISGDNPHALLQQENPVHDERGQTSHSIQGGVGGTAPVGGGGGEGIVVELGQPHIMNRLVLGLWDREPRMYSYYVEVSVDGRDWVRVVDHSRYLCRSRQTLLFPQRTAKYIRIVGTHNSVNRLFALAALEASFTTEHFDCDKETGLIVPSSNVATIENNALVIEGVSRCRNALLNGETTNYDWDNGYTCHQLGSGAITVQLPQPYVLGSMRLLLWDCDERYYSYFVEVSCNQQNWTRVVDKTQQQCRAWQQLSFPPEPVVFIRIVGTHNSANEVFHCVHFECPARVERPQSLDDRPELPEQAGPSGGRVANQLG